ncbi:MAG: DUF3300 domain-containing protein [Burkholderiales bacterium]
MFSIFRKWMTGLLLAACALSLAQAQTPQPPMPEHVYSQQELDQMLAPIALYPDPLLTQILMAATYPLEVVRAARWSRAHPQLEGDEAVRAAANEDWDPSVKSLVAFPRVLAMMDERIDWTEQLGEAFLTQEPYVMDTIQELRRRAYEAGNLRSDANTLVTDQGSLLMVQPVNPVVVYVPYYDPWIVYGTWWWPSYPPVRWAPWPGYVYPGVSVGIYWGSGIVLSTNFFFGAFDWHRHQVDTVYVNNHYYHPRVTHSVPLPWRHEAEHRRGVAYRHDELRRRYPEPAPRATPQVAPRRTEPRRYEPQPGRSRPGDVTRPAPKQQRATPPPQQQRQPQPQRQQQQHQQQRQPQSQRSAPSTQRESGRQGDAHRESRQSGNVRQQGGTRDASPGAGRGDSSSGPAGRP